MVTISDSIDLSRWDEYVTGHPQASPYHLSAWLQAVDAAYHHRSTFLSALDESSTIVGVLPVVQLKQPMGRDVFCSLPFCDVGACLADDNSVRNALLNEFFQRAQSSGVSRVEIREWEEGREVVDGDKVRMMLELPATSDELLARFKSKLRSQIRKAEKNGLNFELGNSAANIDQFYAVWSRNMRDLGSPAHSRAWFQSIRECYAKNMIIGLVKKDEAVVGAGILLFCGDITTIPWASTIAAYNRLAPNMLLYWNLLKHATDRGSVQFDFGRSTLGEGTYKFKQQWGAQPTALAWQTWSADRQQIVGQTGSGRIRPLVESVWRQLPMSFANTLGPVIRKHITL